MIKHLIVLTAAMALSAPALAHHKPGHPVPPGHAKKDQAEGFFPGSPSGNFFLESILAGAICTAPIEEPDGLDAVAHGGPPKRGFAKPEDLVFVVLTEDPDVVQFCWADETPRNADFVVRVSFAEPEEDENGEE